MRALTILLISCSLLLACSFPGGKYSNTDVLKIKKEAVLYTISIEQWGEMRFSGILALQFRQESLYYMLLDATGVTLVEAEVSLTDGHRLVRAMGPLKTSELPNSLSTALKRIYLLNPPQGPCSQGFISRFCIEVAEQREWQKYVRVGPFTVWEAEHSDRGDGERIDTTYTQPWLGVRISIGELIPPKEMSL